MKFNAIFFLLITSGICSSLTFACEESAKSPLEISQHKWRNAGWSHYSYVVQQECFCPPEYRQSVRVVVEDGKVIDASYVEQKDKVVSSQVLASLYTIEDWFAVINKATDENAFRLDAIYHPEFGYPKKIDIDMRERMVDDEQSVLISEVTRQ